MLHIRHVLLQFCLLSVAAECARNFELNVTKFNCEHYAPAKSLIANFNCSLRLSPQPKQHTLATVSATFLRPAFKPIVNILLQASRPHETSMLTIFDAEFGVCEFVNSLVSSNVANILIKTLKQYMNEMPTCPFKRNFTYTLKDFYFNAGDVPSYIPEGSYYGIANFHEYGKKIFMMNGVIDVVYKRTVWRRKG